jgi:hypothetical protein
MSDEDRVYLCTACHWEKVPYRRWQKGLTIEDEEERKSTLLVYLAGRNRHGR